MAVDKVWGKGERGEGGFLGEPLQAGEYLAGVGHDPPYIGLRVFEHRFFLCQPFPQMRWLFHSFCVVIHSLMAVDEKNGRFCPETAVFIIETPPKYRLACGKRAYEPYRFALISNSSRRVMASVSMSEEIFSTPYKIVVWSRLPM